MTGNATAGARSSASPAGCARNAEKSPSLPNAACAVPAARSGASPNAPGTPRARPPAGFTAAGTRRAVAGSGEREAGSASGHAGTPACARAVVGIRPLKAARSASPVARRGVKASGNNMPSGAPAVSAADAAHRFPMAARAANGAPGARPNARERTRRTPRAASATLGGAHGGFALTAASYPRARRVVPPAPAALMCIRANIAAFRSGRRVTRSSRSRRARITEPGTAGRRSRCTWPSRGFPATRSRSSPMFRPWRPLMPQGR